MTVTGKTLAIPYQGRTLIFHNQRCKQWTHPYAYEGHGNLTDSGCGIFGLTHCVQALTGTCPDCEELADFSVRYGGRGDDGTDRPVLLQALMDQGRAASLGFRYDGDGLRNDLDTLFDHIAAGGVALCNLRVGHIVALVEARIVNGEKQLLAVDSYSESASEKVRDSVREVLPDSQIIYEVKNAQGLVTGTNACYAMFWVAATQPKDFNLLHRV